jgi:hypothetical protein
MKNKKVNKKKINWKVILYSILALICLVLVYTVDWIFIVPVLFFIWLNHRELFGKSSYRK